MYIQSKVTGGLYLDIRPNREAAPGTVSPWVRFQERSELLGENKHHPTNRRASSALSGACVTRRSTGAIQTSPTYVKREHGRANPPRQWLTSGRFPARDDNSENDCSKSSGLLNSRGPTPAVVIADSNRPS